MQVRMLPALGILALTALAPCIATGGGALAEVGVRVDAVTGNDATCRVVPWGEMGVAVPCRTVARAFQVGVGPDTSLVIKLMPGTHVLDAGVRNRFNNGTLLTLSGWGGAQTLLRVTGGGFVDLGGNVMMSDMVVTGDAPGTWVSLRNGAVGHNLTVVRPRADAATVLVENSRLDTSSLTTSGSPVAVQVMGRAALYDATVSGGRVVIGDADGALGASPYLDRVVASRGVTSWAGQPIISNSAISVPSFLGEPAMLVTRPDVGWGNEAVMNQPQVVMSSITQRGCSGAVGLVQPIAAGSWANAVVAGTLVQWPQCGQSVQALRMAAQQAGRTAVQWASSWLQPPAGALAARIYSGSPSPGMVTTQDSAWGDPRVVGGNWPAGLFPAAGSPLINMAIDPFSAAVAINFKCSLATLGPNCLARAAADGNQRPANRLGLLNRAPDVGAYEWSARAGAAAPPALPGAPGIPIAPVGDEGDSAPVLNGVDGAVAQPGAAEAGVATGGDAAASAPGRIAGVSITVARTVRMGVPVRVRVRAMQASRVTLVLRRALTRTVRGHRSRVTGNVAVRFRKAGVKWVRVPLNSGARKGTISVAATARKPGYSPGFALTSTRLR